MVHQGVLKKHFSTCYCTPFGRTILFSQSLVLYPDSGISMDEEIVLGDMIWSYNKAEISYIKFLFVALFSQHTVQF